ncbi:MaoC/PaaZ C-terminal domain-containing protein [Tistrella mobilis]|uniref:MaoC/PaaZ C-terminal domain-containing protein n=1 Tax=Tistrella mobilis TaxID=171437 RepID=UPI0035580263
MIDHDRLLARAFPPVEQVYDHRDSILYALGLGIGSDPLDPAALRVTYERAPDFAALPTMVVVLGSSGFWAMEPDTGITWQQLLHGEQAITLHAPLPPAGRLTGRTRITGIVDKGPGRGALIYSERSLTDTATGRLIATIEVTSFARADGGFGGPAGPVKTPQATPERAPDAVYEHATLPQSALIYRLSGDPNPLHADPGVARGAGFDRPILHGLCSYGVAGWSILQATGGGGDPARLTALSARFSSPVFPGETLRTEIWRQGPGGEGAEDYAFRTRVPARDVTVLSHGRARLAVPPRRTEPGRPTEGSAR